MSREKDSGRTKGFDPAEHIGLVHNYITRFLSRNPTFEYLQEEMTSSCLEGLVKASKKYDSSKGEVSTLCWCYFRTEVERCIANVATSIKSNRNHGLVICKSIDHEDLGDSLQKRISRKNVEDQEDPSITVDLQKMLGVLPLRTSKVLTLTYGLFNHKKHTYQEVGDLLGLTRERIRQLKNEGIETLNKKYTPSFKDI